MGNDGLLGKLIAGRMRRHENAIRGLRGESPLAEPRNWGALITVIGLAAVLLGGAGWYALAPTPPTTEELAQVEAEQLAKAREAVSLQEPLTLDAIRVLAAEDHTVVRKFDLEGAYAVQLATASGAQKYFEVDARTYGLLTERTPLRDLLNTLTAIVNPVKEAASAPVEDTDIDETTGRTVPAPVLPELPPMTHKGMWWGAGIAAVIAVAGWLLIYFLAFRKGKASKGDLGGFAALGVLVTVLGLMIGLLCDKSAHDNACIAAAACLKPVDVDGLAAYREFTVGSSYEHEETRVVFISKSDVSTYLPVTEAAYKVLKPDAKDAQISTRLRQAGKAPVKAAAPETPAEKAAPEPAPKPEKAEEPKQETATAPTKPAESAPPSMSFTWVGIWTLIGLAVGFILCAFVWVTSEGKEPSSKKQVFGVVGLTSLIGLTIGVVVEARGYGRALQEFNINHLRTTLDATSREEAKRFADEAPIDFETFAQRYATFSVSGCYEFEGKHVVQLSKNQKDVYVPIPRELSEQLQRGKGIGDQLPTIRHALSIPAPVQPEKEVPKVDVPKAEPPAPVQPEKEVPTAEEPVEQSKAVTPKVEAPLTRDARQTVDDFFATVSENRSKQHHLHMPHPSLQKYYRLMSLIVAQAAAKPPVVLAAELKPYSGLFVSEQWTLPDGLHIIRLQDAPWTVSAELKDIGDGTNPPSGVFLRVDRSIKRLLVTGKPLAEAIALLDTVEGPPADYDTLALHTMFTVSRVISPDGKAHFAVLATERPVRTRMLVIPAALQAVLVEGKTLGEQWQAVAAAYGKTDALPPAAKPPVEEPATEQPKREPKAEEQKAEPPAPKAEEPKAEEPKPLSLADLQSMTGIVRHKLHDFATGTYLLVITDADGKNPQRRAATAEAYDAVDEGAKLPLKP